MTLPFTALVRAIAIRKHRSQVKTGLVSLSAVRKVMILLDPQAQDAETARKEAVAFFSGKGIKVDAIIASSKDLNWYGRLKIKERDEDIFISLYAGNKFEARYEAVCSKAKMKIGRLPLKNDVFDIIVTDTGKSAAGQLEVFETIKKILTHIE